MIVMEDHVWWDGDIEYIRATMDENTREILNKEGCETTLIHKDDVVALAKEFNLVVYESDANL